MNKLFAKDIYIRLAEDKSAFVCTTKWGRFFSKIIEFALRCQRTPEPVDEKAPVPLKVRWALIAVPILMATLDVIENGCIAMMLWTWPHLSNGVAEISVSLLR